MRYPHQRAASENTEILKRVRLCALSVMIQPFLLDGFKFDLRVYVYVVSVSPLEVRVFRDGLARFATKPYQPPSAENIVRTRNRLCVRVGARRMLGVAETAADALVWGRGW